MTHLQHCFALQHLGNGNVHSYLFTFPKWFASDCIQLKKLPYFIGIHIMRRLAHMMFTRLYPMGTEGESFTALLEGFVQFMEYRVEI